MLSNGIDTIQALANGVAYIAGLLGGLLGQISYTVYSADNIVQSRGSGIYVFVLRNGQLCYIINGYSNGINNLSRFMNTGVHGMSRIGELNGNFLNFGGDISNLAQGIIVGMGDFAKFIWGIIVQIGGHITVIYSLGYI